MKFLNANGLSILVKKLSLQDYPNNSTLTAVIDAIDNTKADKSYITENKLLMDNVKVYPVPQLEMSNDAGGKTLMIGG